MENIRDAAAGQLGGDSVSLYILHANQMLYAALHPDLFILIEFI